MNPLTVNRDVYLPGTDLWYPLNLRVNAAGFGPDPFGIKHAAQLEKPVAGGTTISYGCRIPDAVNNPDQLPYVTPTYVRAGKLFTRIRVFVMQLIMYCRGYNPAARCSTVYQ